MADAVHDKALFLDHAVREAFSASRRAMAVRRSSPIPSLARAVDRLLGGEQAERLLGGRSRLKETPAVVDLAHSPHGTTVPRTFEMCAERQRKMVQAAAAWSSGGEKRTF